MSNKRLLQDLTDELALAGKLKKKDADEFLRAFFRVTEEFLFEGEVVKIAGLGTFKLILVEARKSVNVSTGEEFEIQEHYKLSFIPDAELKDAVNEPFSHLEPVEIDVPSKNQDSRRPRIQPEEKVEPVIEKKKSREMPEEDLYEMEEEQAEFSEKKEAKLSEKKEAKPRNARARRNRKKKRVRWTLWILFLLVLSGLGVWAWMSNRAALKDYQRKILQIERMNEVENDSLLQDERTAMRLADSSAVSTDSGTLVSKPVVEPAKPPVPVTEEIAGPKATRTTPGRYDLPVMITMKAGSRLTVLAQKYYGHKAFWVYIYQANETEILDPNNIPTGTMILIPEPDPLLIDPNNPDLIEKAMILEVKILGQ